jgi:hypothetical protein
MSFALSRPLIVNNKTMDLIQQKSFYKPQALYLAHWPQWDIHSKVSEVVENWEWIISVRYKVGDYDDARDAYPVYITANANTTNALTTTRILVPAKYRPILRLLNAKMAFQLVCLGFRPNSKRLPAEGEDMEIWRRQCDFRHEVWDDGVKRNIVYLNSIRESFFNWVEDNYYGGLDATGRQPTTKKMDRKPRCILLETWLMHELLAKSHVPSDIYSWLHQEKNRKAWMRVKDVFKLGEFPPLT